MNRSFLSRNPIFEGTNKNLPLPPNISTDKNATVDILQSHHFLARIAWPDHQVRTAKTRPNRTLFIFKSKSSRALHQHHAVIANIDNGVAIYELLPSPGVSRHIELIVTEDQAGAGAGAGFTLEERYVVRGSRSLWLDTKLYYGHQPQTLCLIRFFEAMTRDISASASASASTDVERLHPGLVRPVK